MRSRGWATVVVLTLGFSLLSLVLGVGNRLMLIEKFEAYEREYREARKIESRYQRDRLESDRKLSQILSGLTNALNGVKNEPRTSKSN